MQPVQAQKTSACGALIGSVSCTTWWRVLIFPQGVVVSRPCSVETGQEKRHSFGQYAQYLCSRECASTRGSRIGRRSVANRPSWFYKRFAMSAGEARERRTVELVSAEMLTPSV